MRCSCRKGIIIMENLLLKELSLGNRVYDFQELRERGLT